MKFRQREETGIPTIDLIPMLTVMMGVLAFFVVISVSLGSEQLIQVDLPPERSDDTPEALDGAADPFIVELDENGQEILNGNPIDRTALTAQIESYLSRNPDKTVYLVPSKGLPYEQVMQFLGDMREVGGQRVSLALEAKPAAPETENAL